MKNTMKNSMKRAYNALLFGFIATSLCNSAKAFDTWGYSTSPGTSTGSKFYRINSTTGNATLVSEECDFQDPYGYCYQVSNVKYNEATSKLEYKPVENRDGNGPFVNNFIVEKWYSYDLNTGEKTEIDAPWSSDYTNTGSLPKVFKSSDGTVKVQVGEDKLVTKKANGEMHIGENSWITKEENGRQKVWAKDAEGNAIPIDYTNGTKLLINGVEVIAGDSPQVTKNKNNISTNTSNINTLGEGVAGATALTAALTALPQISKEAKLSCGVGTSAYSSKYAVGFGCASSVNQRVDINAGGSYVFGGSKSYGGGTLDSGVVKAGFVFKLGELNKPTQLSLNESNELKKEVKDLKAKNNQLLARLEKLENIALKFQTNLDEISMSK